MTEQIETTRQIIDADIDNRYDALLAAPRPKSDPMDHFGRDDSGYDHGGDDCGDDEEDFGDGAPGTILVRECLLAWAKLWQRFDAKTAAVVFHIDAGLIYPIAPAALEYLSSTPDDVQFANCVQLISSQRCYFDTEAEQKFIQPTVAEIAALMNSSEARVIEAVNDHYWMFLDTERDGSPEIGHDGE